MHKSGRERSRTVVSEEATFTQKPDEADLVRALQAGDDAAFETLVRRYIGRQYAVAKRFFHNDDDAKDTAQEAFLSASRAINRFEGNARLSTWLHRITVNAALMKIRARRRKPEESIDDLLPRFLEDGHQADPGPAWKEPTEELMQRQETHALVRACIEKVPENYRSVMLLRDIEARDTAETAELLRLSPNAVKIRLHRARQALRSLLHPHLAEASV